MLANSEIVKASAMISREEVIAEIERERLSVRVGQVRDSVSSEPNELRPIGRGALVIVTKVECTSRATFITYDMVTDFGLVRNCRLGVALFCCIYPAIYLEHVSESPVFGSAYRNV